MVKHTSICKPHRITKWHWWYIIHINKSYNNTLIWLYIQYLQQQSLSNLCTWHILFYIIEGMDKEENNSKIFYFYLMFTEAFLTRKITIRVLDIFERNWHVRVKQGITIQEIRNSTRAITVYNTLHMIRCHDYHNYYINTGYSFVGMIILALYSYNH